MDMKTEQYRDDALEVISRLFSNCDADERDQIEAMEEIQSTLESNIDALREQIRMNEDDEG